MDPNLHFDFQTGEKIRQAHQLSSGYSYPVKFKSIGVMLEEQAARMPEKAWLTYYNDDFDIRRVSSYAEFNRKVNRIANLLLEIGVRRGDRVATIMYNHDDTVAIYFACWKIGACVVPLNVDEDVDRFKFILENSEAKAVFVMHDQIEKAASALEAAGLKYIIQVGGKEGEFPLMEEELSKQKESLPASVVDAVSAEDEALVVYTSGTTGVPKGVLLNQYNLMADADGIADHYRFSSADRFMCVLPVHHVNGITVTLITPLYAGASVVLNRKFKVSKFWERLSSEKISVVSVVPTLLAFLLEAGEDIRRYDLSAFSRIICGAGPLTVDLARRFEEKFGFRITHGYGLSETTCYSCYLPIDLTDQEHKFWMREFGFPSIGIPIKPNEMAIHDEDGNALGEMERGEIVIRGRNVMLGYLKRPDANRETFKHGWFRTGDEGFFKRDRFGRPYFFVTGRIKEMIKRGGVAISTLEIDEVLNSIPGIKSAIAVGFENKWYGEEVGAAVLKEGCSLSAEEILAAAAARLPAWKRPKVVEFVESLPVTSTGKYQRNKLKPLFEKYRDVQFRET